MGYVFIYVADDFVLIGRIIAVLKPIGSSPKILSKNIARVCDDIPVLISTIDFRSSMDLSLDATKLKENLFCFCPWEGAGQCYLE